MAGTRSPLFIAVQSEEVELVLLMLLAGVDVQETSNVYGVQWTPIRMAVFRQNADMVELLVRFGADPTEMIEPDAQTLLHFNARTGAGHVDHEDNERERRLTDVASLLIRHGVDVSARENRGLTALQMAAQRCHVAMVRVMLNCPDLNPEQRATDGLGRPTDGQTAEQMVTHLLAVKLAMAAVVPPGNTALGINRQGDIDATREILAMLRAEPERRAQERQERRVAFAMALIPRLGVASPVSDLEPGLVRMVLETP